MAGSGGGRSSAVPWLTSPLLGSAGDEARIWRGSEAPQRGCLGRVVGRWAPRFSFL